MELAKRTNADNQAAEPWAELSRLHPDLCPRQVLGVRIGQYAGTLLGLAVPRVDKRLFAFVETDGCFADALSVATGCWLGHRTLRLIDQGKVAGTLVDLQTGRAIRVRPDPGARLLAEQRFPGAPTRWHAQLEGYRRLPAEEILRADHVVVTNSMAAILGRSGERKVCCSCGEEILNQRHMIQSGAIVCRSCAGDRYFRYPIDTFGRGART